MSDELSIPFQKNEIRIEEAPTYSKAWKHVIVFYEDDNGECRWRVLDTSNHDIVGRSSEGYHNESEAWDNARILLGVKSLFRVANGYEHYYINRLGSPRGLKWKSVEVKHDTTVYTPEDR